MNRIVIDWQGPEGVLQAHIPHLTDTQAVEIIQRFIRSGVAVIEGVGHAEDGQSVAAVCIPFARIFFLTVWSDHESVEVVRRRMIQDSEWDTRRTNT